MVADRIVYGRQVGEHPLDIQKRFIFAGSAVVGNIAVNDDQFGRRCLGRDLPEGLPVIGVVVGNQPPGDMSIRQHRKGEKRLFRLFGIAELRLNGKTGDHFPRFVPFGGTGQNLRRPLREDGVGRDFPRNGVMVPGVEDEQGVIPFQRLTVAAPADINRFPVLGVRPPQQADKPLGVARFIHMGIRVPAQGQYPVFLDRRKIPAGRRRIAAVREEVSGILAGVPQEEVGRAPHLHRVVDAVPRQAVRDQHPEEAVVHTGRRPPFIDADPGLVGQLQPVGVNPDGGRFAQLEGILLGIDPIFGHLVTILLDQVAEQPIEGDGIVPRLFRRKRQGPAAGNPLLQKNSPIRTGNRYGAAGAVLPVKFRRAPDAGRFRRQGKPRPRPARKGKPGKDKGNNRQYSQPSYSKYPYFTLIFHRQLPIR